MAGSWMFYTTFPKIPFINPEFKNIAQFAPLLGFFIGTIQSYIFIFLKANSWSIYASALICLASGYLITGGLHLDGLMDTFDGIFAGKKRRLKAMKDSKVGSFGVQSLVFITLIQIACLLKIQTQILTVLPICLFWGRFSNLFFIEKFKYVSYKKKSISHKKFWNGFKKESLISIVFILIFITYQLVSITSHALLVKFLFIILISIFLSYSIPNILGNKIGGFNGDACGASVVLVETATLFIYAIL
uniref:Adenosylcobinamide-GDP ribazoletransferase n=1 Tax=uncultured Prochlorococcus marinus clone HOT0M-8G12 TaxID=379396 RepID=Q1PJ68_PROMR|nr:cobalamin-5-phosphate synthase CobS [uncultured Prochlorococcus marinus clone HOT0M-8G12]